MIGRVLGSYRIVREIGRGGMGVVYLAEHPILAKQAAVKVMLEEYSRNQEVLARFFNEAKAAARLDHPAFVEVFDCGTVDGSPFIIMEYVQGEGLGSCIERLGHLPVVAALNIGRRIAEAMVLAHQNGIVHRDLKPDNIMLVPAGHGSLEEAVKVLDFGIAKLNTGDEGGLHTRTGILMGTPLYMSPEQCRGGGGVDPRSDIYSLGCILFALLTGAPPFPLAYGGELIAAHIGRPPPDLQPLNPEVPSAVEALVLQTLAKDPAGRPQSMAALAQALTNLLNEIGVAASAAPATQILETRSQASKTMVLPKTRPPVPATGGTTLSRTASEMVKETARSSPPGRSLLVGAIAVAAIAVGALIVGLRSGRHDGVGATVAAAASAAAEKAAVVPPPVAARMENLNPPPATVPPNDDMVSVKLTSVPSGARVFDIDGRTVLGSTPFEGRFPRGRRLHLRIEHAGYATKSLRLPLDGDVTRDLVLAPASTAPAFDPEEARKL